MPVLLLVALIIVPVLELYVILQVARLIDVVPTLLLLVAMSLLGAYLLRREGARTWRAFRAALATGRVPAKEVADGALVILGGSLLLTPGFATDIFGLLCVVPPTRAVLRRLLTSFVARRLGVGGLVGGGPVRRSRVLDGEIVDDGNDPPGRRTPPT